MRADANAHVAHYGRGDRADQHRRRAWPDDRPTDVRDEHRKGWAEVLIDADADRWEWHDRSIAPESFHLGTTLCN